MKEEKGIWEGFIRWFRKDLAGISDKNSTEYKEGRKFIEELESELNKKTGKSNDDDKHRERERAKLRSWENELRF